MTEETENGIDQYDDAAVKFLPHPDKVEDAVSRLTTQVLKTANPGDTIQFKQRNRKYTVSAVTKRDNGVVVELSNGGRIEPSASLYQYLTEAEATDPNHRHYRDGILITGITVNGDGPKALVDSDECTAEVMSDD